MAGEIEAEKIFVGGIPFNFDEEDLRRHFEKYGSILELFIVRDRETRKPKGYGFIQYQEASEAQAAINAMDDQDLGGRKVNVRHATTSRRDGNSGGRGSTRFSGNRGGFRAGSHRDEFEGSGYVGSGYRGSNGQDSYIGYGSAFGQGGYVGGSNGHGPYIGGYGQTGYGHSASGYGLFGLNASNYQSSLSHDGHVGRFNYTGSPISYVVESGGDGGDSGISKT